MGFAEVNTTGRESNRKGSEADQRPSDQFVDGVRHAYRLNIITRSHRNPVVQGLEQHMDALKRELRVDSNGVHDGNE